MTQRSLTPLETDPKMYENGASLVRDAKPKGITDAIGNVAGPKSRYVARLVLIVDGERNIFAV